MTSASGAAPFTCIAPAALLASGWADDVRIDVADGRIVALEPGCSAGALARLAGPVVPGMPNLHSHAFQRAMAGLTEVAGPSGDSFWSWRELMYRFLGRLSPEHVESIAAELYVEMLEAGYTAVGEFHYLHHAPDGGRYSERGEMALRIVAAARAAGIRLTLLPVLYRFGNFGAAPPSAGQRRFLLECDEYFTLYEALAAALAPSRPERLGLAPHSLRAVSDDDMRAVVAFARTRAPDTPLHIHAAEQAREVADALAATGRTPVEWLLEHVGLDRAWCVVHATHLTDHEVQALARSDAVVGLCPSTEGDLGDGFFRGVDYAAAAGRFGIGGDSHAAVDPFLELRLFETGQRLLHERRNLLTTELGESLGGRLYRDAAAGGAQALGWTAGRLEVGACADLVVLDASDRALYGKHGDALLDAAIFGPARAPVRDVMVAGRWQVLDGRHVAREAIFERFARTMDALCA